jgi:hypothetical protein
MKKELGLAVVARERARAGSRRWEKDRRGACALQMKRKHGYVAQRFTLALRATTCRFQNITKPARCPSHH